jgi:hypothetical protein
MMGIRRASQRLAIAGLALGIAFAMGSTNRAAAQSGNGAKSNAANAYAQARPKSRRARVRPRIRVTPVYPYRLESTPYPPPYDIEYPGPNAVRQCSARLVQEFRPSGTVIVPRMTCWWERG